ncbi:hypothetical protein, partial [Spongiimicrobium salis]|uniref:hypothetical protein n=1 Tax=Spongiimicrobium salis TaxID=1667022 RepID=UPI00374D5C26
MKFSKNRAYNPRKITLEDQIIYLKVSVNGEKSLWMEVFCNKKGGLNVHLFSPNLTMNLTYLCY